MMACPYGVRSWNAEEKCVEKCTLCQHRDEPKCVSICPGRSRIYGDLDDPESDASKAIAEADPQALHQLHNSGTNPRTVYILSGKIATWIDDTKLEMENPEWRNSPWREKTED